MRCEGVNSGSGGLELLPSKLSGHCWKKKSNQHIANLLIQNCIGHPVNINEIFYPLFNKGK